MNQRSLVVAKINLVFHAVGGFNNRLDSRVYDLSGMHVDLDFVADFVFAWSRVGLFRHGVIVRQNSSYDASTKADSCL